MFPVFTGLIGFIGFAITYAFVARASRDSFTPLVAGLFWPLYWAMRVGGFLSRNNSRG